jgi:EAL and modified HD-GYP domain-containing signal transduction protein
MSASPLAPLTLSYRLLWDRQRMLAGAQLLIDTPPDADLSSPGYARYLFATLADLWPPHAPPLLLSLRDPALLLDLLTQVQPVEPAEAKRGTPSRDTAPLGLWIALSPEAQNDPVLAPRARQAMARGLPVLWSTDQETGAPYILQTPERRLQAADALDTQNPGAAAWAVAGWPVDDTLRDLQEAARAPARGAIQAVLQAIEDDASDDDLEALLCADPVLCHRFLQRVNKAAARERGTIDTVRRGLQVWGLKHVYAWLHAQLANADDLPDLRPVRVGMAVHAHLVEHLLDPGDEEDLRREIYLCGLYAQMERLVNESLPSLLRGLPLSQRIQQALLEHSGPYYPALQLAQTIEAGDARGQRLLAESYGYASEDLSRAVLRTLAQALTRPHSLGLIPGAAVLN